MAVITRFLGFRHLRSEPSFHVMKYGRGKLLRSDRGLAFWYLPLSASIAEIPCDDREETFLFHARSRDYQDVTAQGVITYRIKDPEACAKRIDFSIDGHSGSYRRTPLEQLSQLLVQSAQQHAQSLIANAPVRELLAEGVQRVRDRIASGLAEDEDLAAMGVGIVSVRVARVAPTADLEKALQAPTHEAIQQAADEAIFQRRALAVEKERAIAENELQNQIELAKREEQLIGQRGQNERSRVQEDALARRLEAESKADRRRIAAGARADAIRTIEEASVNAEQLRMDIYRGMPTSVLMGLAARSFAGKLESIEHLNVTPDFLGPALTRLIQAGTEHLEAPGKSDAQ